MLKTTDRCFACRPLAFVAVRTTYWHGDYSYITITIRGTYNIAERSRWCRRLLTARRCRQVRRRNCAAACRVEYTHVVDRSMEPRLARLGHLTQQQLAPFLANGNTEESLYGIVDGVVTEEIE